MTAAAMRAERRSAPAQRRAVYLTRDDVTRLRRALASDASCLTPGCRCVLRQRDDELERRLALAAIGLEAER